jgi:hypothetical protein
MRGIDRWDCVVYNPFHAERNEVRRSDDEEAKVELLSRGFILWSILAEEMKFLVIYF